MASSSPFAQMQLASDRASTFVIPTSHYALNWLVGLLTVPSSSLHYYQQVHCCVPYDEAFRTFLH